MKAYFFCRKHYQGVIHIGADITVSVIGAADIDIWISISLLFYTVGFCMYKEYKS